MPAHWVEYPGPEQVHRKDRGVAAAAAAITLVDPGAGASCGIAPMVESACGAPGAGGGVSGTGVAGPLITT